MPAKAIYTRELFTQVCRHIADGKSLRTIAKMEDMPATATIFRWLGDETLEDNTWMKEQYARAYQQRSDSEYEDIADIEQRVIDGKLDPRAAKVAIWSKQWRMGKAKPKKYGDKVQHEVDGPLQVEVVRFSDKDKDE